MAKKSANLTTAAQKLKKGAKKLLGSAKNTGQLAAALPLAALVVEEARAAQGPSPFSQPEQALEQEQELVLQELTDEELAQAAEEEVKELLAEAGADAASGNGSGDLLLAQADTAASSGAQVASDAAGASAGSAGAGATVGAAAEAAAAFDLAGLPLAAAAAAGPVGLAVAAVATAAVVNNADDTQAPAATPTGDTRNDEDVEGTTLNTTLADLQAQGVDAVNTTSDSLNVTLGDTTQLTPDPLPVFGDTNKDGELQTSEDAALDVFLKMDGQTQFDALLDRFTLDALQGAGIDSFNVVGDVSITEAQAQALLNAGIDLDSTGGDVTIEVEGTQLSGTVSTLNLLADSLGVDVIDMASSAASTGFVRLNEAQVTALDAAGVTFAANDTVVFDAASGAELTENTAKLQDLGVDHINLNLDSQEALEALGDEINLADLQGASATIHMDAANIFAAQAADLAAANVNFADASSVTAFVDVEADGTNLSTTLADLHKVGVDTVNGHGASYNLDLGDISIDSLKPGSVPVFATDDHVTLNVNSQEDVDAFDDELKASLGIDEVRLVSSGVDVAPQDAPNIELFSALSDAFDVSALSAPVQAPSVIADDLAADLHASGMAEAVPSAQVILDAGASDTLHTSLKAMGEMGVDGVASDAGKVYVELGDDVNVATLVDTFDAANGLFEDGQDASLVLGEATFAAMSEGEISNLIATISDLGFTEVSVLNAQGGSAYAIDNVAQTLVTTQVQTIGVDEAQALLDVFGADILSNKTA